MLQLLSPQRGPPQLGGRRSAVARGCLAFVLCAPLLGVLVSDDRRRAPPRAAVTLDTPAPVRPAAPGKGAGAAAGDASMPRRLLVLHLRPLDLSEGCDRRIRTLMEGALALRYEVVYLSLPPPDEPKAAAAGPIAPHCAGEVDARLQVWKQVPEKVWQRGLGLQSGGKGLPAGVLSRVLYKPVCQSLFRALKVLLRGCFSVVLSPVWFWDHDSIAGMLFPAARTAHRWLWDMQQRQGEPRRPQPLLVALSDDAHGERERLMLLNETCPALRTAWYPPRIVQIPALEAKAYQAADAAAFISAADLSASRPLLPPGAAGLVERGVAGAVPPAAVASPSPPGPAWHERKGIVFVGNGGNPTNHQGMEWFIREVWPRLREAGIPELTLIGKGPEVAVYCKVHRCHCGWVSAADPTAPVPAGVRLRGELSDDQLQAALLSARVMVVPVLQATGLVTKSLLAFANALPLVLTPAAARGLGEGMRGAATVAEATAEKFAEAVTALYKNTERWNARRAAQWTQARAVWGAGSDVEPAPFAALHAAAESHWQRQQKAAVAPWTGGRRCLSLRAADSV
eukprot:TRINITY_DN56069_c0_g1_i1.p1 TRINITY_DN56069_c0_g1~~TRINITY_DN56069_c0_g1_i1.p1  ORF type:complete len:596 (+),score=142.58 TRINITY_DN56069_c0_g1_i1:87-1790(+)